MPLRFSAGGPPAGAFEIYLSYRPVAAAVQRDKRTIALLLAIGLALLWAILYRIVARASRRLRRQSEENYRLARYDPLTGLPNRTLFAEELERATGGAQRRGGALAVLLIDLERFSAINNTLGSHSGDEVLGAVARRLDGHFGFAARVGGDEYAILCPEEARATGARERAEELLRTLEPPVTLDGVALDVEANVGVAVLGEHADDPEVLLQRADLALAHARSHGSRVEVYSPRMERSDARPAEAAGTGPRGAGRRRVRPSLPAEGRPPDAPDHRRRGARALAPPELGLLAPDRFIPMVEQTALIGPLTDARARRGACARSSPGGDAGSSCRSPSTSSARNLLDPELPERVAALLAEHGVRARAARARGHRERGDGRPGARARRAERCGEMGVRLSIDDFGTGYASIGTSRSCRRRAEDRPRVRDRHPRARARPRDRALDDRPGAQPRPAVVAEGIESEDTMEYLAASGCAMGQGFFFSRPLPPEQLTPQLAAAFGLGGAELRSCSGAVFGSPSRRAEPAGETS